MKTTLFVEYGQNQTEDKALIAKVKELWVNAGNKIKDINTLNVVNEDFTGKISLTSLEEA